MIPPNPTTTITITPTPEPTPEARNLELVGTILETYGVTDLGHGEFGIIEKPDSVNISRHSSGVSIRALLPGKHRILYSMTRGTKKAEGTIYFTAYPVVTYYSDLWDDLLRLFRNRDITQLALDNYFSRMKSHGVSKIYIWGGAFSLLQDPNQTYCSESTEFCNQWLKSKAIYTELAEKIPSSSPLNNLRLMMSWRLRYPNLGDMIRSAANKADIKLSVSFRPFEGAVSTYYDFHVFGQSGEFLSNFHPMATPELNWNPELVGAVHVRALDSHGDTARLQVNLTSGSVEDLRIRASTIPAIADNSKVISLNSRNEAQLINYSEIRTQSELNNHKLVQGLVTSQSGTQVTFSGQLLSYPYLIISGTKPRGHQSNPRITLNSVGRLPISLTYNDGSRVPGSVVFISNSPTTRVAGISDTFDFKPIRYAVQESRRLRGTVEIDQDTSIVIWLGENFSREILDVSLTHTKKLIKNQTLGFDDIILNSRTHSSLADNLDRAYLPRTTSRNFNNLNDFQGEDWFNSCTNCTNPYRENRRSAFKDSLSNLMEDLKGHNVKIVVRESDHALNQIIRHFDTLEIPDPKPRGNLFSRAQICSQYGCKDERFYGAQAYYTFRPYNTANMFPSLTDSTSELESNEHVFVLPGFRQRGERDILRTVLNVQENDFYSRNPVAQHRPLLYEPIGLGYSSVDFQVRACLFLSRFDQVNELIIYESDWLMQFNEVNWDRLKQDCPSILSQNDWTDSPIS